MSTVAWDGTLLAADSQYTQGSMCFVAEGRKLRAVGGLVTPTHYMAGVGNVDQMIRIFYWVDELYDQWRGRVAADTDDSFLDSIPTIAGMMFSRPDFGFPKPTDPADVAQVIVMERKSSRLVELSESRVPEPITGPQAWGSGSIAATTAMRCGRSAPEAVALACELDIYSCLPVTVVRL